MFDTTFWVAVAFLLFIGVLVYYRAPQRIVEQLDSRAKRIREELEEAQRLREETQTLLATYERRQRDAMKEAEQMVQHARDEAKREAEAARQRLEEQLERRQQLALEKIALAEAQAEKDVRDAAVEIAIAATQEVLRGQMTPERHAALVDDSIRDLRRQLN